MDYFDTFEWEAKGAFEAPSTDIAEIFEWEAKGKFETPKAYIFIDLR